MASGTPLIATGVPGLREVVIGVDLLFKKNNIEDLKNKINLLLNNKSYYEEISKKVYISQKNIL